MCIYIHLPGIMSSLLKFADDTKIFSKVTNTIDELQLQQDVNRLCDLADKWQIEFNIAKWKTMHIGSGNIERRQLNAVMTEKTLKAAEHCYEA